MDFLSVCCSFSGALCCIVWRNVFVYSVQHLFFSLFPCKPGIPHAVNTATVTQALINIKYFKKYLKYLLEILQSDCFHQTAYFLTHFVFLWRNQKNEWSYLWIVNANAAMCVFGSEHQHVSCGPPALHYHPGASPWGGEGVQAGESPLSGIVATVCLYSAALHEGSHCSEMSHADLFTCTIWVYFVCLNFEHIKIWKLKEKKGQELCESQGHLGSRP